MMRYLRFAVPAVLLAVTIQRAFAAPPSFQFVSPTGWGVMLPNGITNISGDGSTVIGTTSAGAIRWQNGVTTTLGSIPYGDPNFIGYYGTTPRGVSVDGSVIVGTTDAGAFRWEDGVMTVLGEGVPMDLSADGSVAAGYGDRLDSVSTALRWDNGVVTVLGSGSGMTVATAVSADGMVVVGNDGGSCRWQNGVKALLGNDAFLPWGVSADGGVVVGGGLPGLFLAEAWRWEDGAATGLGHIPSGDIGGTAWDTSANGSVVVGTAYLSESNTRAFIWTAAAGMRDLNDVLVNDYGLDLAGWTLIDVMGISDDGLTLTGNASKGYSRNGWIAHIPEPGAIFLLAFGAVVLPRRRSHRD